MSDIQQGMLFHSFKDDSFTTYHDQNLFGLTDENFNYELFQKAILLMIEKHAVLRTVFNLTDFKDPIQIVLKEIEPDLEFQNLEHLNSEQAQYDEISKILEEDRKRSFDLKSYTTLWRVKILKLPNNELCILWLFHHAVFDGWSTSSFITELHNIYKVLKEDITYKPTPLKNTYKKYVVEQLAYKESEDLRDFWKKELADYKRYTLKNKIEESDVQDVGFFTEVLDQTLLDQIRTQSKLHGVPLKTYCLAAYLYMLKMFTYDSDILIGVMSNNRPLCDDSDKILGCFLNATPFRMQIPANITWIELLQLVNDKQTELTSYDKLSFFEIVKMCKEDTTEQNPFFDAAFDFLDFHVYNDLDNHKGLQSKHLSELNFERTNAFLDFDVSTTMNRFRFNITYATPLFDEEKIQRFALYYKNILNKMAYEVQTPIRNEELYASEEKEALLFQFNKNEIKELPSKTFVDAFENEVVKSPTNIAVVDDNIALSYNELNLTANKIGALLKGYLTEKEEIVILYFDRGSFLSSAMIGTLKSGAAFVAIDTETPEERIKFIIENSKAKVVLTQTHLENELKSLIQEENIVSEVIAISSKMELTEEIAKMPDTNLGIEINGEDLAYVIYTSGTTGVPKGVMLHHEGLSNHLWAVINFMQITNNDVIAQTASCNFDVSIMQFLLCLVIGGKTAVINKDTQLQPKRFLQQLEAYKTTIIELVPSHVNTILDNMNTEETYLQHLRYFMSTGEVLPERLVAKWYEKRPSIPIVNAYGPAETSDDVTLHFVEKIDKNPIPIGKPLQNIHVHVVDEYQQLCPIGITGEILIGGVAVGKGYWNNTSLTEKSFIKSPFLDYYEASKKYNTLYRTGDLGYWTKEGNLIVKGRIGNMVKIRGNRIELGEVENHLDKVAGIEMSIVEDKTVNDERVLCAYYITNKTIDVGTIREQLLISLPKYMLPTYYVELEEFPTSQNGKILRDQLPIPEIKKTDVSEIDQDDISDMEHLILNIWKEVLGINEIGLNDNFFDVGGHSLNLIKVNTNLNELLEEPVSIVALFQYPTIRSLAAYLQKDTEVHTLSEESMEESVELIDDAINFFSED